tara:strand:- start:49 stop:267 length:219 start_codon:yes stop_codon:yes gene_type:complete
MNEFMDGGKITIDILYNSESEEYTGTYTLVSKELSEHPEVWKRFEKYSSGGDSDILILWGLFSDDNIIIFNR